MKQSTSRRGYGQAHQKLRARWQRVIDQQGATCTEDVCLMPSRVIPVGDRSWHLAHTTDRTGYKGPAHAKCNTTEGTARRNGKQVRPRSREW